MSAPDNKCLRAAVSRVERVTGIEPALSAWESTDFTRNMHRDQHFTGSASDRETPLITGVNGPLMARRAGAHLYRRNALRPRGRFDLDSVRLLRPSTSGRVKRGSGLPW
jgi:hypothetical protein